MGTFLRNLQVRLGGAPTETDRAQIAAAVHRLLREAGFVVTDDRAEADRTIAIAPHGERAVCDVSDVLARDDVDGWHIFHARLAVSPVHLAEGPPAFARDSGTDGWQEYAPDEALRFLNAGARNTGGPAQGLRVVVWGSAARARSR